MAEKTRDQAGARQGAAATDTSDPTRNNQEHELEAEQESAAAMDSDVPQPADASETTEGQPS
ncbi:MAG: hypothetical protein H0W76_06655 [Pyrinomonadaceae bacterium]|nr:hypothetical protein [Pyrinomonadaceae bacterium]